MEATKVIYSGLSDNQILYIREKLGLQINEALNEGKRDDL